MYTDAPYPTPPPISRGCENGAQPLGTQSNTFAPESSQILAISSPGIVPYRDLPPATVIAVVGGKRCPFECAIPLPMPVYRPEDITGLGFKGKRNLGTAAETRSFLQNKPRYCTTQVNTVDKIKKKKKFTSVNIIVFIFFVRTRGPLLFK